MPLIFAQTVTRLRATQLRDADGVLQAQSDWSTPDSLVIDAVSVQPDGTSETRDAAGINVTEGWRIFTRRGRTVDIKANDRIVYGGVTYDVIGNPQAWGGLLTGQHHQEIVIRKSPATRLTASGVDAVLHDATLAALPTQAEWTP